MFGSSFTSFKKKLDTKNLESSIFYDDTVVSPRKAKFGKQTSMNNLREDAKNYLTPKSMLEYLSKKSSFGSLTEGINLKDLKNQTNENIFNIGQETDKETQYKIFLCMNTLFLI